ncbi:MAG: alpha-L-fucosidase [Actinobacteria bacterium]|nr:alpha-L-fucosidase [Actinomycetota bacterium]
MYEPTWDSVSAHPLPRWYDDAKLGVFVHWGLYSVPGWAPQVPDILTLIRDHGPAYMLRNNPYAEWYLNSMQIDGSPTQVHHHEVYGAEYPYENFVEVFNKASREADLDAMARLCQEAGARYVVLTTKHHEGFTLWPSSIPHPTKGEYHAERDLVGDLTAAVRDQGMRMGLYYSGGYDWPFNDAVLAQLVDSMLAVPKGDDYREFATAHVRELIDRYQPAVLWNDICWPSGGNLAELFAHYYNSVEDGVVNDRWIESTLPRNTASELMLRGFGEVAERLWRFIPEGRKELTFSTSNHFDFSTPEYKAHTRIKKRKWEATRGVGNSFGANRNERAEHIMSVTELVRLLADVVSKNGNLLIGIGPEPDGSIPDEQQVPLRGLGIWLDRNGDAIYGSRPWTVPAGNTSEGTPLRFTARDGAVFAILVEAPGTQRLHVRDVDASGVTDVRLLGVDEPVSWTVTDGRLEVTLPDRLPVSPAHTFRLSPASGIRAIPQPD